MPDEVKPVVEPTPPEGGTPAPAVETPVVERPDWLDPRFKTPEDQAKAYREAEKMAQQKAQYAAELERQNRELLARTQQTQHPPVAQENLDELFWQKPTEVMTTLINRQLQAGVAPFIEDRYQMQKDRYANDPEFKKYEPQIDQMVAAQPELKKQPGAVSQLYKIVRAMEFDPEAETRRIEAEVLRKHNIKTAGMVEGAGSPPPITPTPKVELSAEEQATARKFYSDVPPQEAYKRYFESKKRMEGGA